MRPPRTFYGVPYNAGNNSTKRKTLYIAAFGPLGDHGSCRFAWIRTDKDAQRIRSCDVQTPNQAIYRALINVLQYLAPHSRVLIFTYSQLLAKQFSGEYRTLNEGLLMQADFAQGIIDQKRIDLEIRWIRKERNLAATLLKD